MERKQFIELAAAAIACELVAFHSIVRNWEPPEPAPVGEVNCGTGATRFRLLNAAQGYGIRLEPEKGMLNEEGNAPVMVKIPDPLEPGTYFLEGLYSCKRDGIWEESGNRIRIIFTKDS